VGWGNPKPQVHSSPKIGRDVYKPFLVGRAAGKIAHHNSLHADYVATVPAFCFIYSEFMTRLIREYAPGILARQTTIELTNARFDNFLAVCNDQTLKPSKSLMDAAKRLASDGY
jgi:hypothetical protein